MKSPRFIPSLLAILASSLGADAAVLLNDTFADGNRSLQDLPNSAAFYYGSTSANGSVNVVSNTLQFNYSTTTNTLAESVAYFTNSGSPVTLGVGEKLTASFSFSADAISNTANSLRFGIFNSGGSRVSADYSGVDDPVFSGYSGYSLFTNLSSSGSNTGTLRQRTSTSDTLFSSTANTNLKSSLTPLSFLTNTTYTLTLELEALSATETKITYSDTNGNVFTVTDTASPFTSFDTFAVFFTNGSNASANYTLDNISVVYSPVPEPATAILCLGGLAGLFLLRRRSHSHHLRTLRQ